MSEYMCQMESEGLLEEEEEEEEEDDNNFIDDEGECDYSAAIREIFGYDKRRWVATNVVHDKWHVVLLAMI